MLGLALGLAQLYDCCYLTSGTLLALFVTVSLSYRLFFLSAEVALVPNLALIPMKVSRVEEKDAAQQKTQLEMPALSPPRWPLTPFTGRLINNLGKCSFIVMAFRRLGRV